MTRKVYLVVGVPGSGKTWVCKQLVTEYTYVPHDDFIGRPDTSYVVEIIHRALTADKPMLVETPFSISQILEPLKNQGMDVECIFIIEPDSVVAARYMAREQKVIPKGHLTRQRTYEGRAQEMGAFMGSSKEVYERLKYLAPQKRR